MQRLIIVLACLCAQECFAAEVARPNIIILMADDMGIGDTSAYQDLNGNSDALQVRTPHMERLSRLGIRFSDAHSPSSRCTATRYSLLTGRYSWRTRLKFSVLWGPQGDPLIEPGRPTLATFLKSHGYATGMSGKWHVGLTYRDSGGEASSYDRADLRQGIADGPLNHGFDFFHGTSRSHPTSATQGWLFGDRVVAATASKTVDTSQFVLSQTGPKNFEMAKRFLDTHFAAERSRKRPFFLYYACHSNHTKHTPAKTIDGVVVQGQSHPGGARSDFIFENDVVLGRLMHFLETQDDPRRPGAKLVENTLVIFTSDNGAERRSKSATGPLRSNKASVYEGGHRVPFIATWKLGGIGDGDARTPGLTSTFPIVHVDLFATLAQILKVDRPPTGAEDSFGILDALRGKPPKRRPSIIHHDHKQGGKGDKMAWLAIREDDPVIAEAKFPGQWKLLVDESLLLRGEVQPRELYELRSDLRETTNRLSDPSLTKLVDFLGKKLKRLHDDGRIRTP